MDVIGEQASSRVEVLHRTRLSRRNVLLIRNRGTIAEDDSESFAGDGQYRVN